MAEVMVGLSYVLTGIAGLLAGLTVAVWGYAVALQRKFAGVLLRWEKPAFSLWTAALFAGGLFFLSGGMLSYALAIKYAHSPLIAKALYQLSGISFGVVGVVGLLYLGLRYHYLQPISERGIYKVRFDWSAFRWEVQLIPWEQVYDYYIHYDGVLAHFTLILRDRQRFSFSLPMHLYDTVERIIDIGVEKYSFLQSYGRKIARSSSEP
ncbi:MAG: hypothetical protein N3A68_04910 [Bacteroidia bacterium]|jgi:hypothetical protein|nr:hypothetical protein [Bacteroidia bacterium]GIV23851.1 MAG: hypothetical protein KatS3mg025_1510 [Bacteroidia bacterium]